MNFNKNNNLDLWVNSKEPTKRTTEKRTEQRVAKVLEDEQKPNMVDISKLSLDQAIDLLFENKNKGINCFIYYNWTIIYSAKTKNIDDVYIMYFWMTKAKLDEIKKNAQKLDITKLNFDEAVDLLLEKKNEGINCFFEFNNVKFYSATTRDIDDAYIKYFWETKTQHEKDWITSKRQKEYIRKIYSSREEEEIEITKDVVVAGLKFIAEHPDMERSQLIDKLISLGCKFTDEDIKQQFPETLKPSNVFQGLKNWNIWYGAIVISGIMQGERRSYYYDRVFSWDYEDSIYAFIRKVTGDETYTKEYVDSLVKKEK